jgi:phospholipid/cholesterol/gamma-HCH transport system substrate-binding protein
MEREANYAAVGAFVLIVAIVGALFVWWYSGSRDHKDYQRYEIYFEGSVSGLDKGAAVRYLGVGVGRVIDMSIDPRDSARVEVIVDIDTRTPISDDTVAILQLQGVTGLLYIDLMEDREHKRQSLLVASLRYPVIRSAPSRFDVFLSGLPELVSDAVQVVNRVQKIISDENVKSVQDTLSNLETMSRGLPQTARDLNALIVELRGATADISASAKSARAVIADVGPGVESSIAQLRVVADHLADATDQLDKIIAENRQDVRSFARDGLPEIERFVREGRAAAADVRALAESLRENPTQLLYQPQARGVEIPK